MRMARNIAAARRWKAKAKLLMPWLDTPDFVAYSDESEGLMVCVSEPYRDYPDLHGVFRFEDGELTRHFSSPKAYDTTRLVRIEDFDGKEAGV